MTHFLTRRQLIAGAATLAAAAPLSAFKSKITKASISAITDEIGLTQAEAIDFAHHYGLSWIELRNLPETKKEFAKMTEPELKRAAAELASNKLKVSFLNTSMMKFNWPGLNPGAPVRESDQKKWDSRKDDLANALLAANILGTDKVRVFTGSRVAHPETTYKLIVQTLEEFIPMAEKAKVHLLIENEYSQNIGNSPESRDILELLPSKTIGLNWDPGNAQELKEIPFPDGYAVVPKNRILNIQFKASNTLDGPNKMNWTAVLEALEKDNYQYCLGLETHGDNAKRMDNAHASMEEMLHDVRETGLKVSKAFGIGFAVAVLVIIFLVWRGFDETKGNHLAPSGFISNVRVQAIQEEETLMVIDFRLINDADVTMTAAKIDPWITTRGGQDIHGTLFASADMPQTFKFYPSLGPILHPPLLLRGTIDGHQSKDFMIGVEFDVPARVIESRKAVTLHIEDPTGPFVELTSK